MAKQNIPNGNNSQSIDDILQLLKTSYEENDGKPTDIIIEDKTSHAAHDDIQNELKKLFMDSQDTQGEARDDSLEYALDADFLREVNTSAHEKKAKKSVAVKEEDMAPWEEAENVVADTDTEEEGVMPSGPDDVETETIVEEELADTEKEETIINGELSAIEEETAISFSDIAQITDIIDEIDETNHMEELEEEEENEELEIREEADEIDEAEIIKNILMASVESDESDPDGEYDAQMEIEEPQMTPIDISDMLNDSTDSVMEEEIVLLHEEENAEELAKEESKPAIELDNSAIELLLQLGCKDELEETIGEEGLDEYYATGDTEPIELVNTYAYNGEEYLSREQNEEISERYKTAFRRSLLTLCVTAAVSLVMFLYDILPLFEVEFFGVFDYSREPLVYLLFGLQILIIGCIVPIKKLARGLKDLIFSRLDGYSVAAMLVVVVAAYDISLFAARYDELPNTFHFLAMLAVLCATVADHLALCREKKLFSVYSSEGNAYTLLRDDKDGTVADKMYKGGMDRSQKVRVPASVEHPTRYFHAVCDSRKTANPVLRYFFIPTLVLSVMIGVVCMIANAALEEAVSSIWIIFMFATPVAYILCDEIFLYISACRLAKRGVALASRAALNKYGDTNVIVFSDTHLFSMCEADKAGIVFLDKKDAVTVLGALNALYSVIGGPMSTLFENIPNEYKAREATVLRAFRNGVEAIIDKKHLLIVGDASFMERYGLDFSVTESTGTRATLCVSFDGKVSAKVNASYKIEPLFENILERLSENGVYCAIETFDPLINGKLVKRARCFGSTPVSIVHKTAKDIYTTEKKRDSRKEETGLLVKASRLKLAEAVIWCKRLLRIRKMTAAMSIIGGTLTFLLAALLCLFGLIDWSNQYLCIALKSLWIILVFVIGILAMPKKNYFSRILIEKHKKKKQK